MARTFGFVPLPLPLLIASLLIVFLYVVATELTKLWFYGRPIRSSVANAGVRLR